MTRIFLDQNETFHLLSVNRNAKVFGNTGREVVRLCDYPAGAELDGNIEVVQVTGEAGETTLRINDSGQLELARDGKAYATFTGGLNQPVDLQFTDGNVTLKQTGANSYTIQAPENPNNVRSIDATTARAADAVQLGPHKVMVKFGWLDETTYISGTADGYNVKFEAHGAPSQNHLDGIARAAERVSDIITGGISEYSEDIFVSILFIDLNGYWGTGSPESLRPDSLLPARGDMKLDRWASQSLDAKQFEDLVLHEFLHCLGFGVLWESMGLVTDHNGDLRFNGPSATAYYNSEFSHIAENDPNSHLGVPIETDGASGTAGKHWDEATFGDEVMTSYLGGDNHVSNMTIAALYDMGYEVIV